MAARFQSVYYTPELELAGVVKTKPRVWCLNRRKYDFFSFYRGSAIVSELEAEPSFAFKEPTAYPVHDCLRSLHDLEGRHPVDRRPVAGNP